MQAGADRITVDTSLAVPLVILNHEAHQRVVSWRAGRELSLGGHAWIETFAVLTRLPGASRVSPGDAVRLLRSNFTGPMFPSTRTMRRALDLFAEVGIAGGATYDGLVALAALDHASILASRDGRAGATYHRLGVTVEMVGG